MSYRGRFAPSPTGLLHFGSLLAATASYLQARSQDGEWWLRIEDIDPPREVEGASKQILKILKDYGFCWDNLSYQSKRLERYQHYYEELISRDLVYDCGCTRKQIAFNNIESNKPSGFYPGNCREGLKGKIARSVRLKIPQTPISIKDAIQGEHQICLAQTSGDFIIKRTDGYFSYQLAVAIDDSEQKMTQIVRGYDLHESSFQQNLIQQMLQQHQPTFAHIPIAVDHLGDKLSKQSSAKELTTESPQNVLWHALNCLNQAPPQELKSQSLPQLWRWGIKNWRLDKIQQIQSVRSHF